VTLAPIRERVKGPPVVATALPARPAARTRRRAVPCPVAAAPHPLAGIAAGSEFPAPLDRFRHLMDLTLGTLGLYAALTTLVAAMGPALALAFEPTDWSVGMADALAAGMMLGIAYPLMRAGLDGGAVTATIAGGAAVVILLLLHIAFRLDERARPTPSGALLAATLHSAPEGLALGVAAAVEPRLGIAVALTLALHNVGEALVLSAHLSGRAAPRWRVLASVVSNLPQFVLALAGFATATATPALRPALLGVSAAALVYLALADLLPDGYRVAGRTALSVTVIAATALVAFAVTLP